MEMYNADGSRSAMCGNGIRCVGKYVFDRGYTDKTEIAVETLSGIKYLKLNADEGVVKSVAVEMGVAETKEDVLLSGGEEEAFNASAQKADEILMNDYSNFVYEKLVCSPVSVGNPHAVFFVKRAEEVPLEIIGPVIEHSPAFPGGVNAEFVEVLSPFSLRMRVWERGSGITMACGTGACASVAAAVKKGFCKTNQEVSVQLDGGALQILVREDGSVCMTGPAEFIYDGSYPAK